MIVSNANGLQYYQFESLSNKPIIQAIFTRNGGTSREPWNSLNIGNTVGDDPEKIKQNLANILSVLGYRTDQLAQVRQIHSSKIIRIDNPNHPGDPFSPADGMVSNRSGVLLMMRFADCVPIFLFDPVLSVVGIAHAGWKGTVKEIGLEIINVMQNEYGSDPNNIIAGIGPSIGPDHYQIGKEVVREIKRVFPDQWNEILIESSDSVKLDLWKANQITLRKSGVKEIEVAEICTACNLKDWFSHRGDKGKTGRFAAVIGIN
jgi:hypothetical protein